MDSKELKEIGLGLSEALNEEGQPLYRIRHQLGRIISHLESEQRDRMALHREVNNMSETVKQHDKALFGDRENLEEHPGTVHHMATIIKGHKRNAKLLMTVIATVGAFGVIEILKLVFAKQ